MTVKNKIANLVKETKRKNIELVDQLDESMKNDIMSLRNNITETIERKRDDVFDDKYGSLVDTLNQVDFGEDADSKQKIDTFYQKLDLENDVFKQMSEFKQKFMNPEEFSYKAFNECQKNSVNTFDSMIEGLGNSIEEIDKYISGEKKEEFADILQDVLKKNEQYKGQLSTIKNEYIEVENFVEGMPEEIDYFSNAWFENKQEYQEVKERVHRFVYGEDSTGTDEQGHSEDAGVSDQEYQEPENQENEAQYIATQDYSEEDIDEIENLINVSGNNYKAGLLRKYNE